MWRLLAFLAWPLVEIGLFVAIGGRIGVWPTLAWVVISAVIGVALLRAEMARGAVMLRQGPGRVTLREGASVSALFRALAAVMLILPGFLTDAIGLVLLLPPVQHMLSAAVLRRVRVVKAGMRRADAADVIDGEWIEVPTSARRGRSGWTDDGAGGGAGD
ncbi:MAG: FxsA family protein [Rhodobacteraceae bacterium]|jgi:UPF0716 protein FxsA|nr:FxsA family protein [Paracoccaceae bacterium]